MTEGHGMGLDLNLGQTNPKNTITAIVKMKGLPRKTRNKEPKLATTIHKRAISHASGLFKKKIGTTQNTTKRDTIENTTS
jgi:hypothetical protein